MELKNAGAEVTTGVGKLGVVGIIKNGPGKTVLVRSDLDALPVTEATGLPYASKATTVDDAGDKVGVMHACGHDIHMTNLVGTARWLAEHKEQMVRDGALHRSARRGEDRRRQGDAR